jgi:hypothetical protein
MGETFLTIKDENINKIMPKKRGHFVIPVMPKGTANPALGPTLCRVSSVSENQCHILVSVKNVSFKPLKHVFLYNKFLGRSWKAVMNIEEEI